MPELQDSVNESPMKIKMMPPAVPVVFPDGGTFPGAAVYPRGYCGILSR